MKVFRYLIMALAFSLLAGFPYKASSLEHIPFYATNPTGASGELYCGGPWYREACGSTSGCNISAGAVDDNFYTVDVDIFSPYGNLGWCCCWNCAPSDPENPFPCLTAVRHCGFSLEEGDTAVYFTVESGGNLSASFTSGGDDICVHSIGLEETSTAETRLSGVSGTSTTQANLGDDNTKPRRDRDTFTFNFGPNPGDRLVTVTLRPDFSAGHDGSEATLILQNGNSTVESKTDVLPIEITATLPSDGDYRLVVSQNNIPEDVRYRGRYILSVKSDPKDVQDIEPTEDVEQF